MSNIVVPQTQIRFDVPLNLPGENLCASKDDFFTCKFRPINALKIDKALETGSKKFSLHNARTCRDEVE